MFRLGSVSWFFVMRFFKIRLMFSLPFFCFDQPIERPFAAYLTCHAWTNDNKNRYTMLVNTFWGSLNFYFNFFRLSKVNLHQAVFLLKYFIKGHELIYRKWSHHAQFFKFFDMAFTKRRYGALIFFYRFKRFLNQPWSTLSTAITKYLLVHGWEPMVRTVCRLP